MIDRGWSPPESFDDYRIERVLGCGGMGVVYLGYDRLLQREIAVKFLQVNNSTIYRQRFTMEAQAVARIHHPNVVTIYRAGMLDERPFLVMEYVRGSKLADLKFPIPWKQALDIAAQLSGGLAAAHRRGVLHRDIKPSNIIVSQEGAAKLLDFGLAKLQEFSSETGEDNGGDPDVTLDAQAIKIDKGQTGAEDAEETPEPSQLGAVIGTPRYMAPEVRRGEPATRRSDIYSLGVVLFELCTGKIPSLESDGAPDQAADEAPEKRLVRELTGRQDPPPHALAALIARCLAPVPARRFASADELSESLKRIGQASEPGSFASSENPYRGLQSFDEAHKAMFFGREEEARVLAETLKTEPLLIVAGDSGVGKSSLCKAGLIPLIREGGLGTGASWQVLTLVPGRRPIQALASVLAPLLEVPEAALAAWLVQDPRNSIRELRQRLGSTGRLLLLIDQFEEVFTLVEESSVRERVAELVQHLAENAGAAIRVIATVRGDFLTKLATMPWLREELRHALYILGPLSSLGLRRAIVEPAHRAGFSFESEEMVERLVESYAPTTGGLPLLQFAMAELWLHRNQSRKVIPLAAVAAIGGVTGALSRHGDGVLAGLLPRQRRAARRIMLRLVTAERTRARRTRSELGADEPEAATAMEALISGRLVCAVEEPGGTAYEVTHESLLERWSTLRSWLTEVESTQPLRHRLAAATREWERSGSALESLWSKAQLREAEVLDRDDLSGAEQAFLVASRAALVRRGRTRWLLAGGIALAVGGTFFALQLAARRELLRRVQDQEQEASGYQAKAQQLHSALATVRASAFDAYRRQDSVKGESLWSTTQEIYRDADKAYDAAQTHLQAAQALLSGQDQRQRSLRKALAELIYSRLLLAEDVYHHDQRAALLLLLRSYDPDGQIAGRLTQLATVRVRVPVVGHLLVERFLDDQLAAPARVAEWPLDADRQREDLLQPGSYRFTLSCDGCEEVSYPLLLTSGKKVELAIEPPGKKAIPQGYVYVPPGDSLYGSAEEESVRVDFLAVPPLHPVRTEGYLIGRTEVTIADWIEFLNSLPAELRRLHSPHVSSSRGELRLEQGPTGSWHFFLKTSKQVVEARSGERLHYALRTQRVDQDWLRFPIAGITIKDATAYTHWLETSGRVPGARLCTEYEWERAARGADGRSFPHGNKLEISDANFDETYSRQGFGPDEVGSYPQNASPFRALDMVGNVTEWTVSPGQYVLRGGSWYQDRVSNRSNARESTDPDVRDITIGMRVCASVPTQSHRRDNSLGK